MNRLQHKLRNYNIILGSQSPRRKELLQGLDIQFEIRVKDTNETFPETLHPAKVPEYIAANKFKAFVPELTEKDFLITADTIVIKDSQILQKPINLTEAKELLEILSGSKHEVITAVCFGLANKMIQFSSSSVVTFSKLNKDDIDFYVETYKPLDKAGAYGVQEWIGYVGIEYIEGSYFNVMGLPVQALYSKILVYEI